MCHLSEHNHATFGLLVGCSRLALTRLISGIPIHHASHRVRGCPHHNRRTPAVSRLAITFHSSFSAATRSCKASAMRMDGVLPCASSFSGTQGSPNVTVIGCRCG